MREQGEVQALPRSRTAASGICALRSGRCAAAETGAPASTATTRKMAITTRKVSVSPGAAMKLGSACGAAGLIDVVKFNSLAHSPVPISPGRRGRLSFRFDDPIRNPIKHWFELHHRRATFAGQFLQLTLWRGHGQCPLWFIGGQTVAEVPISRGCLWLYFFAPLRRRTEPYHAERGAP